MTKKRFGYGADVNWQGDIIIDYETEKSYDFYEVGKLLNELNDENEQLKQDIENLKITIDARETLIDVCEKKFRELGYIITVDDDEYVIEQVILND